MRVRLKLLILVREYHQSKILKRVYLQVRKILKKDFKWCKSLGVDSSSGYCTPELGLIKNMCETLKLYNLNM
jgi:hypothetical protein